MWAHLSAPRVIDMYHVEKPGGLKEAVAPGAGLPPTANPSPTQLSAQPSPSQPQATLSRDVILKIVALFCIACVILAIVLAHRSPAAGYELSIYASTPCPVLWLLLMSLAGGVGIVLHEVFTSGYEVRRTYLVGFAVILLGAAAFLCLPIIRNYVASSSADQLGHVGFLMDFMRSPTGDWISRTNLNIYPLVFSLLTQIASITGLSALQVVNLNTALVLPIFVLMAYLLATAVFTNEGQRLLVALIAGGTMAGISRYYLLPNTWSILMLPLLFYCYFKQDRIPFRVLLVVLLVVYPFFHPLSSVVIMLALTVMELPKPVYSRLLRRLGVNVPRWIESRPVVWPILLEAAVFTPWVLTRQVLRSNVYGFWHQLATFGGGQGLQEAGNKLSKANVQGLGLAILMFKMYGELLIFLILATLAAILIVKQIRLGIGDSGKYRLLHFGVWIPLALLFFAADFVGVPALKVLAADRMLVYIETACIPFVAFALWEIVRRTRFSHLAEVGMSGLVILVLVLNFYGHYSSPYLVRPNDQVTNSDMAGMTWYLDEKDPLVSDFHVLTPPARFSQALFGWNITHSRQDLDYASEVETHFGYDNFTTIREQYGRDIYVSINRPDRVVYQTVWQNLGRFNDADFERLEQDPTVDRIYSNGEMDVLFVSEKSGP